jgi:hypothetical protein
MLFAAAQSELRRAVALHLPVKLNADVIMLLLPLLLHLLSIQAS